MTMTPVNDLLSHGFVNVRYNWNEHDAIKKSVLSWREFCSLAPQQKKLFEYTDEGNLDGAGYELKEEKGKFKDLKENFHITRRAYVQLMEEDAESLNNEKASLFLENAYEVLTLIEPLVLKFADAIEAQFKVDGLVHEVEAGKSNWFLRYLHYFGNREVGEEIATAHVDKCGFTLHLYESAPGLEYLEFNGDEQAKTWKPMPVVSGETAIISSMQLQYRTKGHLKALCHRVVATADTAREGRYSMVCFIPLLRTPMFNKMAKGRLQEFQPGFNYNMKADEFNTLFA